MSHTDDMPESKISDAQENEFCSSFYTFGIKQGIKEDYMMVGESKEEKSL